MQLSTGAWDSPQAVLEAQEWIDIDHLHSTQYTAGNQRSRPTVLQNPSALVPN